MTRKEPSYTESSLSCWFPVCFDHVDEECERFLFRDGDGSEVPGNTFLRFDQFWKKIKRTKEITKIVTGTLQYRAQIS
jgi:hypothetical protein